MVSCALWEFEEALGWVIHNFQNHPPRASSNSP